MKTHPSSAVWSLLTAFLLSASLTAQETPAVDSTGLPGDHFSLEGAVELFKKAASPEEFEKLLNTEANTVNNLDLNEDGETDYIRVIDHMEGNAHAIVLQVPVSETESQDVAVIEIEKTGEETATLQILGDEDLYGKQVIAEPFEEEAPRQNRNGPAQVQPVVRIVVNVWAWPAVRFVYRPGYVVYVSPWRWRAYPGWWRPWRPHPWRVYHLRVRPYRAHCHVVTTHRVVHAHRVYAPRRTHSTVVHSRTTARVHANGPRGGHVSGRKTTTSTTVTGKKGRSVTKTKSTTKVQRGGRGRRN